MSFLNVNSTLKPSELINYIALTPSARPFDTIPGQSFNMLFPTKGIIFQINYNTFLYNLLPGKKLIFFQVARDRITRGDNFTLWRHVHEPERNFEPHVPNKFDMNTPEGQTTSRVFGQI